MVEAETYPTSSTASSPLSISRCGETFLPYMFHSLKHGKATPNSLNDCTGQRLSQSEDPVIQLQSFFFSESKFSEGFLIESLTKISQFPLRFSPW